MFLVIPVLPSSSEQRAVKWLCVCVHTWLCAFKLHYVHGTLEVIMDVSLNILDCRVLCSRRINVMQNMKHN